MQTCKTIQQFQSHQTYEGAAAVDSLAINPELYFQKCLFACYNHNEKIGKSRGEKQLN